MAAVAGVSITAATTQFLSIATERTKRSPQFVSFPRINTIPAAARGRMRVIAMAAPDQLSGKVEESIKNAQETCADDPVSGECAAAWDEVEELSAAAGHARQKNKVSDPLENYCKDNPDTDECRTYDN